MALRRPTLIFCIVTLVLGVNHKMSLPFPAANREVEVVATTEFKRIALNLDLQHTICDNKSSQRKKRFKPSTSFQSPSKKIPGTPRHPDRCCANLSIGKRRWGVCFVNETEEIIGVRNVKVEKGHSEGLCRSCSVASPEKHTGGWNDTTFTPRCPGHLSKHLDTGSTPSHPVSTTNTSMGQLNMPTSILTRKRVSRSRKRKNIPHATFPLLLSSLLPSLKCPLAQESLDTPIQHTEEAPSKLVSKNLHCERNHLATSLHSNDTHTRPNMPTPGCDQSHPEYDIPHAQLLKHTLEGLSSMDFTAVESEIFPSYSKADALEVADGDPWDLYNKSIPKTWDNSETHLNSGSTLKQERDLSLLSLCITLIFFRNEEVKQRVITPLFNIYKDTSIQKLIEEFLQRLAEISGSKQLSCPHEPDKPAVNSPGNDQPQPTLHTGLKQGHSSGFSSLKNGPGIHKSGTEEGKPTKTDSFFTNHWLTHFTRCFIPRRPPTLVSFPASFLPSAGSSSQNMAHLGCRLASLHLLPTSCDISRTRLAQAGFYYDNGKTARNASDIHEVTCYSCGLSYAQWKKGDNPHTIHQQLAPNCQHLKENNGNVPGFNSLFPSSLKGNASLGSSNASSGYWSTNSGSLNSSTPSDQSGPSDNSSQLSAVTQPTSAADSRPPSETEAASDGRNQQPSMPRTDSAVVSGYNNTDLAADCAAIAPGVVTTSASRTTNEPATWLPRDSVTSQPSNHSSLFLPGDSTRARLQRFDDRPPVSMNDAVYPQFTRMQVRRDTFEHWPLTDIFHPDNLVLQGFYYAGYEDCIRCFYCGVGLKSWCRDDDVMDEHIRWRPSCGYVLNTKGRHFVEEVSRRLQASSSQGQSDPANSQSQGTANAAENAARQTAPSSMEPSTHQHTAASGSPGRRSSRDASGTAANATAAAAAAGGGSGGVADNETVKALMEMGFDRQAVEDAIRRLRQSGTTTRLDVNAVLEAILAPDSDDGSEQTDGATAPNTDLQTDSDGAQGHLATFPEQQLLAERLASENQRLKERNLCRKCKVAKVGLIFLPCGHIAACTQCGKDMRTCCMCDVVIRATANVYI